MKIKFLKANNGDAILINFVDQGSDRRILIDGGTSQSYFHNSLRVPGELKLEVDNLKKKGEVIDLLILTHIDDDHIGGLLAWFSNDPDARTIVKQVWFNSGGLIADYLKAEPNPDLRVSIAPRNSQNTSIVQGVDFAKFISESGIWDRRVILAPGSAEAFGLTFRFLSPDLDKLERLLKAWKKSGLDQDTASKSNDYKKTIAEHIAADVFEEDTAFPNGSSIAFLLERGNKKMLFLGDAHPSTVTKYLRELGYSENKPVSLEFIKLSHHGSAMNTSPELLSLIETKHFIVSSSGEIHQHPHKQLLSRIIDKFPDCILNFNYPGRIPAIFSAQDHRDFKKFQALPLNPELEVK